MRCLPFDIDIQEKCIWYLLLLSVLARGARLLAVVGWCCAWLGTISVFFLFFSLCVFTVILLTGSLLSLSLSRRPPTAPRFKTKHRGVLCYFAEVTEDVRPGAGLGAARAQPVFEGRSRHSHGIVDNRSDRRERCIDLLTVASCIHGS
jgi:hypothetical protein